jgi:hypothetical protein
MKLYDDEETALVPVIPGIANIPVDGMIHNQSGFCYDMAHSECHENRENISDLNTALQEGKITTADADRIYKGQTV